MKDLGQPLDSVQGLKYLTIIWSIVGANPPTKKFHWRILYYLYSVSINFLIAFCFNASMLINLFFITSFKDLVANLSLSTTICMSVIKQVAVFRHRQGLLQSRIFLKLLDKRCNPNKDDRKNIFKAIYYAQLFPLFFPFYMFCSCGFSYNGWSHHQMIYNAWYPDLFSDPEDNYLAAFIYQFLSQIYLGFQCVFNDIYPLCYLILMTGHLESLSGRISRIGWNKEVMGWQEKNIEELKHCITDHKNLLSYFDCIRPAISTTLFCQFIITGLALCLTYINLTFLSRDFNEQFFDIIYVMILVIQVFPCCWQVNVLMEKSNYLTTAIYNCNWMDQNLKFRKILIIFMQSSQKTNTIMAGNLAPVTLQTFLSIIRFSFSMFTLLSKM